MNHQLAPHHTAAGRLHFQVASWGGRASGIQDNTHWQYSQPGQPPAFDNRPSGMQSAQMGDIITVRVFHRRAYHPGPGVKDHRKPIPTRAIPSRSPGSPIDLKKDRSPSDPCAATRSATLTNEPFLPLPRPTFGPPTPYPTASERPLSKRPAGSPSNQQALISVPTFAVFLSRRGRLRVAFVTDADPSQD
ncbi:hypothetical protein JX266_006887 [Neoarthrinium moseri]|uniref:uncharacterized protein n=1 Tax=Neoarthrinium moseri TaxID=1658444 RepID=UPI001FDE51EF|nr:uncharacterized protein JN550_002733 [Neoarthrinium moseri]KAI1847012.1 hypothetical protein JX266_006887 [Neoarthrinium moseri]KAI1874154.1 hypothetical protein JN550_002733 [Neoarthrinium moseri]